MNKIWMKVRRKITERDFKVFFLIFEGPVKI